MRWVGRAAGSRGRPARRPGALGIVAPLLLTRGLTPGRGGQGGPARAAPGRGVRARRVPRPVRPGDWDGPGPGRRVRPFPFGPPVLAYRAAAFLSATDDEAVAAIDRALG